MIGNGGICSPIVRSGVGVYYLVSAVEQLMQEKTKLESNRDELNAFVERKRAEKKVISQVPIIIYSAPSMATKTDYSMQPCAKSGPALVVCGGINSWMISGIGARQRTAFVSSYLASIHALEQHHRKTNRFGLGT